MYDRHYLTLYYSGSEFRLIKFPFINVKTDINNKNKLKWLAINRSEPSNFKKLYF